jgi:hypothetical protein
MRYAILVVFTFFFGLSFSSCKSDKLSKKAAKELLIKQITKPIMYTQKLNESELTGSKKLEQLFANDLFASYNSSPSSSDEQSGGGGFFIPPVTIVIGFPWDLTEKGKKYYVKGGEDYSGNYTPIVNLANLDVEEIESISYGSSQYNHEKAIKMAMIKCSLRLKELTPFGEILLTEAEKKSINGLESTIIAYKEKKGWIIKDSVISLTYKEW